MANMLRHTADSVECFFTRLAEAIKAGKSDAQVLVRLVRDAINSGKIVAVKRDKDGKTETDENGKAVLVPLDTPKSWRGFMESADIALAVYDVYQGLKLEYGSDQLLKDADREAHNIIRTAAALLGNEMGLKKSKDVEKTSFKLDLAATPEDVASLLISVFAKDNNFTKVTEIISELNKRLPAELRKAA